MAISQICLLFLWFEQNLANLQENKIAYSLIINNCQKNKRYKYKEYKYKLIILYICEEKSTK